MTISNTDPRLQSYRDRLIRLEQERRDRAEDIREVGKEMKGAGLLAEEIAAIKILVKRHFEDDSKRAKRERIEETVEDIAAKLGDFVSLPLGAAAVERA